MWRTQNGLLEEEEEQQQHQHRIDRYYRLFSEVTRLIWDSRECDMAVGQAPHEVNNIGRPVSADRYRFFRLATASVSVQSTQLSTVRERNGFFRAKHTNRLGVEFMLVALPLSDVFLTQ